MEQTTTRVFIERKTCTVWIGMTDNGELQLSGQDLGGWMGTSEYEYFITVDPADFHVIRSALGVSPDADIIDSMCAHADEIYTRGERTWLKSLDLDIGFSNWHSFD